MEELSTKPDGPGAFARYTLWPRPPLNVVAVGHRKSIGTWVTSVLVVAAVLSLPPIRAATGISLAWVLFLLGAHLAWSLFVVHALRTDEAFRSRLALDIAMGGNLLLNTAITVAFCVIGGDPKTPLWMLPVAYALLNAGLLELGPSWVILGVHVLAPLAAIPLFLLRGADVGWSFAAPSLCAGFSAATYHVLASTMAHTTALRREHEGALAALQAELDRRDRARLARDLHDSVGSALGAVGLYGDLIERNCERPEELRSLANMVRDATREGLTDLRSVLGALAPTSCDVAELSRALAPIAQRASEATGAKVTLELSGEEDAPLDGPARLAVMRVFQEAVHNAVKHSRAANVRIVLGANGEQLQLDVADDGVGLGQAPRGHDGRGLRGMRERVEELGGSFLIDTADGKGTRLRVTLPRACR